MAGSITRALEEVRDTLLEEPVSPRVEEPRDINVHYCRYVAETVVERLDDDVDVRVLEDGARGYVHTWLEAGGRHYDAECLEGVTDHRDLPFFRRHPEAAEHVEPASTDPATVRNRGREPLYPEPFAPVSSFGDIEIDRRPYLKFAVAGIVVGLGLVLLGLTGEWAISHHLARLPVWAGGLFVDLELVGLVIALVSPIVFVLIRPAHRASTRP